MAYGGNVRKLICTGTESCRRLQPTGSPAALLEVGKPAGWRYDRRHQSQEAWPEMSGAMKYAVVIERGPTSFGAHVPDLPGCVAVGETKAEVLVLIREAIELYLEALEEDGETIPSPQAYELTEV